VAAHATYPLGSRARVTNLANGKSVEVEIVDRFPSTKRIINVSEEAARQLGFIQAGSAEVRVEPVRRGAASHTPER
jgi:rare lipoprotein A